MMTQIERAQATERMQRCADDFYRTAIGIGNHPFIEFAGLMNEYIQACRHAQAQGIDFTECNNHGRQVLPLHPIMSDYINEKLECILSGSKVLEGST